MCSARAKLKIGVLMGGRGIEREVSLNSGRTICDHLDTDRYQVVPVFQTKTGTLYILPERFLHRGKISDFEHRLDVEAQKISWHALSKCVDLVYIAMHGRYAEDGTMQGMLEVLSIPYVGSKVFASALGMDKIMQKSFLEVAGIEVPAYQVVTIEEILRLKAGLLDKAYFTQKLQHRAYPLIVKPHQEGSSFGVFCVENEESLCNAILRSAYVMPGKPQSVLIEEKINGMEFSCILITDYKTGDYIALPPTEIVPESAIYEYDQKYMPGRAQKITPARCSQEQLQLIQRVCVHVARTLEITNIARIDGFLTPDNRVVIVDPNTFSGMAPSSFTFLQAAQVDMSHTMLINHLIETEIYMHDVLRKNCLSEESNAYMYQEKTRVAVLMGGDSAEKEISLESGRNIVYKLSPQKYEAIPIFIDSQFKLYKIDHKLLVSNSTHEIVAGLDQAREIIWDDLPKLADFVFIGLHGGKGENGAVQGALEMLGMPYNGSSVFASALCMDKFKANHFLQQQGFAVPRGRLIDHTSWSHSPIKYTEMFDHIVHALIVKPHNDGCSTLVYKVHNDDELHVALENIFSTGRAHALVEECIVGTELTVGVVGNRKAQALPPSQAVARAGILSIEEKFLPGAGENQTPALLPADVLALVKKTMEDVYQALQCRGYARIDCFYQTAEQSPTGYEHVVIIEVNTLPGMTPATCIFHQAAELGMKPMDFIDTIITLGFEEHTVHAEQISEHVCKDHRERQTSLPD